MEQLMEMLRTDPLTFSVIAGVIGTVIVALITRARWSAEAKRWVALGVFAVLTLIGVLISYYPTQWEMVLSMLAVVIGVGQAVFTALKPTGIFNWLEDVSTPGYQARHTADPVAKLTD